MKNKTKFLVSVEEQKECIIILKNSLKIREKLEIEKSLNDEQSRNLEVKIKNFELEMKNFELEMENFRLKFFRLKIFFFLSISLNRKK